MNKSDFKTLYFDDGAGAEGTNTDPAPDDKTKSDNASGTGDNNSSNDSKKTGQNKTDEENTDGKTYTEAEFNEALDKMLKQKWAKMQKKAAAEAEEAAKLAKMTEQEKLEHERDKLQAELNELKKANAKAEMRTTARGILQNSGVNVSDKIIDCLITEDAETTNAVIKDFIKQYKADVQAGIKSQLSHKSPASGGTGGMTLSEIMKEPDIIKRQKLISENFDSLVPYRN